MDSSIRRTAARLRDKIFASIWLIPAVVLPMLAATLSWFAYDEYRQTIEQEYRFLEAHARIADSHLAGLLRNVRQLLKRISDEQPAMAGARHGIYDATLAERRREMPELHTLVVTNADGQIEFTDNQTLKGFDASRREYFIAHRSQLRTPNFHISRPFATPFGDHAIAFSTALRDDRDQFLGVLATGVNYKYFESVMKPIQPAGGDSVAAIIHQDGDIIYRLPEPTKYVGTSVAAARPFQDFRRSGLTMRRSMAASAIDGIERIYVHRTVGDTSLAIAVARPVDEVLAGWRRNLALRALMFAFAAMITIGLAVVAHRRQKEVLAGKEFSEQLIATANVMVVGLDNTGRVIIFNQAAERISGYLRDEILGRDWFETAMPCERHPQTCGTFRNSMASGDVPRSFESPIMTRNGAERLIAWQNSAIRNKGETVATISFGIDVTDRGQLEEARHNEEVSRRLIGIQDEERRRLAIDLHDRTGANLAVLGINIKLLADALPAQGSAELEQLMADTSTLLKETIAAIRAVSIDFRPPLLDYAGFWPALEGYAQQFSRHTGIAVHTERQHIDDRRLPSSTETNLLRIAQEALANCARHSQAQTVYIVFARRGGVNLLTIADDGVGFDPNIAAQPGAADQGLATMRKRAEFMGGRFTLKTRPGKGTRIAVILPATKAGVDAV